MLVYRLKKDCFGEDYSSIHVARRELDLITKSLFVLHNTQYTQVKKQMTYRERMIDQLSITVRYTMLIDKTQKLLGPVSYMHIHCLFS